MRGGTRFFSTHSKIFSDSGVNSPKSNIDSSYLLNLNPVLPKAPLATYPNSLLAKNVVSRKYSGRAVIYMWFNTITSEYYIGSSFGGDRLSSYFRDSTLTRNMAIYKSLLKYGYENHMLFILEDLGSIDTVAHQNLMKSEQIFIDWNFATNGELCLNRNPIAGGPIGNSLLGSKNPFFGKKHQVSSLNLMSQSKKGDKNPMYGKAKSPEFLAQQQKDMRGPNNPQWGVVKSPSTILKISKKVFVYDALTGDLIHSFDKTAECKKSLKMSTDTLYKYIQNELPYKGMIFTRSPKT